MEGEEIGMVLARASELKCKFANAHCAASASTPRFCTNDRDRVDDKGGDEDELYVHVRRGQVEEEEEGLLRIRDAFEALEQQLSALQALQQQQRYERESALYQIDRSRKVLFNKLKEYKGDDLEVIQEALTFAGGTYDHDSDLLLPPYATDLPGLSVMDDLYPSSRFPPKYGLTQNGMTGDVVQEGKKSTSESQEKLQSQSNGRNKAQHLKFVFGLLAKSALTFVGVVSVLSLAGYKPVVRGGGMQFKIQELFQRRGAVRERETEAAVECPPGKVLVVEEGQLRCLVKERVEIPFDVDASAPKIRYGFG